MPSPLIKRDHGNEGSTLLCSFTREFKNSINREINERPIPTGLIHAHTQLFTPTWYLESLHRGCSSSVGSLLTEQLLVLDGLLVELLVGLVHLCTGNTLRELLLETLQLEHRRFLQN